MTTDNSQIVGNSVGFEDILKSAGITNAPECWLKAYEESHPCYPGIKWELLDRSMLDKLTSLTKLPTEFIELLSQTLDAVREDPNLSKLAWLWHYLLFDCKVAGSSSWPVPCSLPNHLTSMFPAVVVLSGLQPFLDIHKRLAIPESVTRNCLLDVGIWAEDYRNAHGRWGLAETHWLQQTLTGILFRLGRLQFMHINYPGNFKVYRNRTDKQVIALAGDGMRFRLDGKIDGTNDIFDEKAWVAYLETTTDTVKGYPVSSNGRAVNEQATLHLDVWQQLLTEGTGVLDVHIPAGAKMGYDDCIESYRLANEFFPEYFPDQIFTGFICTSWLLDPNLQEILPPDTNISRFQKEFYLMPVPGNDNQTFERVFGSKPQDLNLAPRDTSLRKAILDHVLSGQNMHQAFGFIPCDEIGDKHNYYRIQGCEGQ